MVMVRDKSKSVRKCLVRVWYTWKIPTVGHLRGGEVMGKRSPEMPDGWNFLCVSHTHQALSHALALALVSYNHHLTSSSSSVTLRSIWVIRNQPGRLNNGNRLYFKSIVSFFIDLPADKFSILDIVEHSHYFHHCWIRLQTPILFAKD